MRSNKSEIAQNACFDKTNGAWRPKSKVYMECQVSMPYYWLIVLFLKDHSKIASYMKNGLSAGQVNFQGKKKGYTYIVGLNMQVVLFVI